MTDCRQLITPQHRHCPVCDAYSRPGRPACIQCGRPFDATPPAPTATPAAKGEQQGSGIPGDNGCPPDAYEGLERVLQSVCDNRLTSSGVSNPIHLPPSARTLAGLPDHLFVWKKLYPCAVEYKVRGGRVKPEQRECMLRLKADGWNVAVCWSLPELDRFLASVEAAGAEPKPC